MFANCTTIWPLEKTKDMLVPSNLAPACLPAKVGLWVPRQWSWACWFHSQKMGGMRRTIFCRQPWRGEPEESEGRHGPCGL